MQYRENQKTMKFLMGLDTSYAAARSQILLMNPLPSVNKMHSHILQDGKQRSVSSTTTATPDIVAFAVRDGGRNSGRGSAPRNPHLKCDRCDMVGHTSDTFRSHLKCDFCGWKGHIIDACRKLKKAKEKDNAQDRHTSKTYHVQAKEAPSSQSSFVNLTAEQYQNLLALLGNNKSPTMANLVGDVSSINNLSGKSLQGIALWKNRAWILDSVAMDHAPRICSPLAYQCKTGL